MCSHCKKKGHEEAKCCNMHLEMLPKKLKDKGKQKTTKIIQQDLGSNSRNDTKITTMGSKGISTSSSSSLAQSSKLENVMK